MESQNARLNGLILGLNGIKNNHITDYQTELVARKGMVDLSEREIKLKIIEKAETIAKAISRGKDVELRKSASGISVCEVSKKVVSR